MIVKHTEREGGEGKRKMTGDASENKNFKEHSKKDCQHI